MARRGAAAGRWEEHRRNAAIGEDTPRRGPVTFLHKAQPPSIETAATRLIGMPFTHARIETSSSSGSGVQ